MSGYNHDKQITDALGALSQGDVTRATALAKTACENRAEDAESWSVLGLCLARDNAQSIAAKDALHKATTMEPSEPRWWMHLGTSLFDMGEAAPAEQALAKASELSKGHPQAMIPWAKALSALERHADAAQIYGRIIQVAPSPEIWIKAGDALTAARDTINAVYAYENAYPDDARPDDLTAAIADMHIALGQYDRAKVFNDRLRDKNINDPDAAMRAANLLRWDGDLDAAIALQKASWTANPTHARLTAAMLEDGDEAAKDAAIIIANDAGASQNDRRRVAFALTHFFDKRRETDKAWHYATLANSLYDAAPDGIDEMRDMLRAAIEAYAALPDPTGATAKMVYIIGPPRSGGSLLQTILARTTGAKSVGERGALLSWLPQMLGKSAELATMTGRLQEADIAGMTKAAGSAKIFIDKTPHHVLVAGVLSKVHAGAVCVAPWRNPADMAVSLYFHEFGPEFAFTRTLDGIADYLDFHADAVTQWRAAGLEITDHDHDAFSQDPAKHGAALCKALGLPWSEAMLTDTANDGAVRTFSARQVRGGVSTKFAGRGARYAGFLGGRFDRSQD
ncbi:sulfotransferase [Fretibacter rubidus]|uniref:tetratricopeptide repeat-containing sulfotransferase family protein n=1 Tax=Fretibacter rubidus TaxID=570162 RepID=UPI00352B7EB6